MKEISAGEVFTLSCTGNSVPQLKVDEKIPKEKSVLRVLKINGSEVTLGPLQSGNLNVSINCSNGSVVQEQVAVKPLGAELQGQRFDPLGAVTFPFPWIWLLSIIAIIFFTFFGITFALKKKKKITLVKTSTPPPNPRAELQKLLQFFNNEIPVPEAHHMHQLYKALRSFVEGELQLTTQAMTTAEFLGTFRALALKQSTNQTFVANLEYLLRTADDVRFAGRSLSTESWKDYLKRSDALLKSIEVRR